MSNVARVAGQAANTLSKPLSVEEVFSTYLYEGTGAAQTITNGIDLDGEGGLVWIKERGISRNHHLVDTERGIGDGIRALRSNLTDAEYYQAGYDTYEVTSANSDGFSLGLNLTNETNRSTSDYASWTFRKAPKFFDVVTYTGDGVNGRELSHNLGSVPGCIIIKNTSTSGYDWITHHVGNGSDWWTKRLYLNQTSAAANDFNSFYTAEPTATSLFLKGTSSVNASGETYVAYLFAHNDGDGGFGDGTQDIIKCGSYTGNGSSTGPEIDLGFEPQWVLVKCATAGGSSPAYEWYLMDTMRGMTGESDTWITVNSSAAESTATYSYVKPEPNGFKIQSGQSRVNASGETYIYIAIRRGPMAVPTDATDVFAIDTRSATNPSFTSNFVTDFALARDASQSWDWVVAQRLTQGKIFEGTHNTDAEYDAFGSWDFDFQNGYGTLGGTDSNYYGWMWRRAPNYFDVVAYTGDGTAGRTVSHNLGVAPEMIWVKNRGRAGQNWKVYHAGLGASAGNYYLHLDETIAATANSNSWNNTNPTDTVFTLGGSGAVNLSGDTYIAYLFASVDGVSKVGSFSYTYGSDLTVDCGFTSGPRFLMVKKTSATGGWIVIDTERGFTSGNDPWLRLNERNGQNTSWDIANITPTGSGFIIPSDGLLGSGDYIFYAIA